MRRAYREELSILENVIEREREALVEVTDKKWEELFRKRENQEISNSKAKFEQVEEFNQRMESLRMDFQVSKSLKAGIVLKRICRSISGRPRLS